MFALKIRKIILIFSISFYGLGLSWFSYGQGTYMPIGARSIGMGSAFSAVAEGPDGLFYNPAGISQTKTLQLNFYLSNPFQLPDLYLGAFSGITRTFLGSWGLGFQSFGNKLYQENIFSLAWSRLLYRKIYVGTCIHVHQISIQQYGTDSGISIGFGTLMKLSGKFKWSFVIRQLTIESSGKDSPKKSPAYSTGLSMTTQDNLLISFEVNKEPFYPIEIRCGCELTSYLRYAFRCGFTRNPNTFSFGLGFIRSLYRLNYAVTIHPVLGLTHHGSLQIDFVSMNTNK